MTTSTAIIIVGLGPGRWEDLTLEARALLEQAAYENTTVYFRTLVHPTVEPIGREIANLRMESFDSFYDESGGWDTLYQRIVEEISQQHPKVPCLSEDQTPHCLVYNSRDDASFP